MINSIFNIIFFVITTAIYYTVLNPKITVETINSEETYKAYTTDRYTYLGVYFLLTVLVQFMVNASILSSTCGGNLTDNIGAAGTYTFIPWILIFGVMIIVLVIFPGFKSAFSDVIGYYYVSRQANTVLTELLMDKNIQTKIDASQDGTTETKGKMQDAADAVIKIFGEKSVLINQIVPNNFQNYWNTLRVLMKPKYQTDSPESNNLKQQFFNLVVVRDQVGEAMWFIYTGILLASIVQLKLLSRGCETSLDAMQKNYQKFKEEEKKKPNNTGS